MPWGLHVALSMFQRTRGVVTHFSRIERALDGYKCNDNMRLFAWANIRAETATCMPVSEGISHLNTNLGPPLHRPYMMPSMDSGFVPRKFDRYESRRSLGNKESGDGFSFHGRGFIQLTGRENYKKYGETILLDLQGNQEFAKKYPGMKIDKNILLEYPDLANDEIVGAYIIAAYLFGRKNRATFELNFRNLDLWKLREIVNGKNRYNQPPHGLEVFEKAFHRGWAVMHWDSLPTTFDRNRITS